MSKEKKLKHHYIDNKEFFKAMVEWKKLVVDSENSGDERPSITEYIGECFFKIAEHLSYKPNFINYQYKEEMIGDGIENCLMYAHNFDPEKSKNPFSYFTQIIYYAFLRRIEKEKKQSYIKYKAMELLDDGSLSGWYKENYFEKDSVKKAMSAHFNLTENDIEKFTPKKRKKKAKKVKSKTNLESALQDEPSEDSTDK
tara:strand:+ start:182 stop:775 length:594 start_codon:yes stop_codon:yes gene_type:complete